MSRVLLIIHDMHQDDNQFPSGVGYIAGMLHKYKHDVEIYNADVFHYNEDDIGDYLSRTEWDIIGMGFMAGRYVETVKPLCDVINAHKKDAWFVLGGHGPSSIADYILKDTNVDLVIEGEAETQLLAYAHTYDNYRYPDLPKKVQKLDELPWIPWDFFPVDEYKNCCKYPGQADDEYSISIITARGCIGQCSFCYRMTKSIRYHSIERVIKEIKYLYKEHDITYFNIQDELFVLDKKRLKEFEQALKKEHLEIKYACNARVDWFDEDIADILKRTGCQKVNVGFESMDQSVLKLMNKRTTVQQNIDFAELCHKKGLNMGLNFMWGCPGDTEESLFAAVDFIKKYNTYGEIRTIRPVTPFPGSPLYYQAIKDGLLGGPADFFEKFTNSDRMTVNFTDIQNEEDYYDLLYQANTELIDDHRKNTELSWKEANDLKNALSTLYYVKGTEFRGARHYARA